jgi:calcium-dependent protein kinase
MINYRKPENFLMSDKTNISEIKVIDFGLSKCYSNKNHSDTSLLKTIVGTPLYIAPEILKG